MSQYLVGGSSSECVKPFEPDRCGSEVDDGVVRDGPGTCLIVAPRWPSPRSAYQARLVAQNLDVSSEPFGQQQPMGGVATVGRRADHQRFRGHDVTFDFLG